MPASEVQPIAEYASSTASIFTQAQAPDTEQASKVQPNAECAASQTTIILPKMYDPRTTKRLSEGQDALVQAMEILHEYGLRMPAGTGSQLYRTSIELVLHSNWCSWLIIN